MDPVLEANGTFALNLLKKLGEDSSKNVFFSPCSISSSLAMVLLGARGFTESQIAEVLGFNKCSSDGDGDVHQSLQLLLSEVNKTDKQYLLRTANRLFGDKAYKILSTFKDACRKFYQAEMEELDFTFTEECRRHINSWVARNTEDKITELLTPELLNESTVLVLVNAIYFKGKWEKPFSKDETQERPFKVSKDVVKPVPMMHKRGTFNATYIGEIFTKILMLPYVGKELNMIILLPDEHVDLQTVEKKLTYKKLVEWTRLDMMDEEEVEVYLPRFRMEENYNMKEVLQSLGMKDAFDSVRADFSGMSSSGGLVLSEVVHKSFVEVSEEGTEAVAATAAIMMLRCARFSLAFNANRPFLFFIQHSKSKAIMFCGRFASP